MSNNYKKSTAVPVQKKKKGIDFKSLSFWIILFFILFWSIGSALSVSMFAEKKIKKAYADETSTVNYFQGSSVFSWLQRTRFYSGTDHRNIRNVYSDVYFKTSFHTVGTNFYFDSLDYLVYELTSTSDTSFSADSYQNAFETYITLDDNATRTALDFSQNIPTKALLSFGNIYYSSGSSSNEYYGRYLGFERSESFGSPIGVTFGKVDYIPWEQTPYQMWYSQGQTNRRWDWNSGFDDVSSPRFNYFIIKYFDKDGNYVLFYGICPVNYNLDVRTYLFSSDSDDTYNYGYQLGLQQGLSQAQPSVRQAGYDDGYSVGYSLGKQAGQQESTPYTFQNLLGAVIDAPITVISESLNFEILGVNLASFFFGLLTIALIVFVVKLIL